MSPYKNPTYQTSIFTTGTWFLVASDKILNKLAKRNSGTSKHSTRRINGSSKNTILPTEPHLFLCLVCFSTKCYGNNLT